MSSGLRYETGRDMPPGMLEKVAVKLAEEIRKKAGSDLQLLDEKAMRRTGETKDDSTIRREAE